METRLKENGYKEKENLPEKVVGWKLGTTKK
jgi:hypothetical protein